MKKLITREQRQDWRNLPAEEWNVATVHAMVVDLNAEKFGVETYVPFRNWGAERAIIKRALETYGADVVSKTITEAFAEYKPTRQYPQLTAGFIFSYMASRIVPRLLASVLWQGLGMLLMGAVSLGGAYLMFAKWDALNRFFPPGVPFFLRAYERNKKGRVDSMCRICAPGFFMAGVMFYGGILFVVNAG